MLLVLVSVLGPVSGAHMKPAGTLVAMLRRDLTAAGGASYIVAQLIGALAGVLLVPRDIRYATLGVGSEGSLRAGAVA